MTSSILQFLHYSRKTFQSLHSVITFITKSNHFQKRKKKCSKTGHFSVLHKKIFRHFYKPGPSCSHWQCAVWVLISAAFDGRIYYHLKWYVADAKYLAFYTCKIHSSVRDLKCSHPLLPEMLILNYGESGDIFLISSEFVWHLWEQTVSWHVGGFAYDSRLSNLIIWPKK